jgi:D-3-phosphoglycerate dehydrogenase
VYQIKLFIKSRPAGLDVLSGKLYLSEDIQNPDAGFWSVSADSARCGVRSLGQGHRPRRRRRQHIPIPRAARSGQRVFNTPGANANAVKEMVISGMLLASRKSTGNNWAQTLKGQGAG